MTTFASKPRSPADAAPADQASRLRQLIAELGNPVTSPAFAPVSASRIGPGNGNDPAAESAARVERVVRTLAPVAGRTVPIIAIGSGKGGVGKTSSAVNLCVALSALGLRATLVDADLGMANADVMCGITPGRRMDQTVAQPHSVYGDAGARTLSQISIKVPTVPGKSFVLVPGAAGVARMADLAESQRLALLDQFAALEAESDVLIVDTGAGLSPGVTTFLMAADLTLVLATPEPTSIADAYALIKCLRTCSRVTRHARQDASIALVVSQARDEQEALSVHQRIDAVSRRFLRAPLPLAGWVRLDGAVGVSVRQRAPLLTSNPQAPAAGDLRRLAIQLAGRFALPIREAPAEERAGWLERMRRVFHISTTPRVATR